MCSVVFVVYVHAERVRGCEGDGNAGVVGLSTWHEHVGGTRGSGMVSNAADMLGISVVRGMKGVGRVCEICMCLD